MKKKNAASKTAMAGLAGLAGAAALAAGTDAYAYTVRYEGPYDWCGTGYRECFFTASSYLDISKPVSEQTVSEGFRSGLYLGSFIVVGSTDFNVAINSNNGTKAFSAGETIDGGSNFLQQPNWGGLGSFDYKYVGLRLPDNRYGWVQVDTQYREFEDETYIKALAWGYETEPGVGIAAGAPMAPEPGSLAMLAAGAVALVGGRRLRRKK